MKYHIFIPPLLTIRLFPNLPIHYPVLIQQPLEVILGGETSIHQIAFDSGPSSTSVNTTLPSAQKHQVTFPNIGHAPTVVLR